MRVVPNLFLSTLFIGIIGCQNTTEPIAKKNPTVQVWQTLMDGEWQVTRNVYYSYNKQGEPVEELMVVVREGTESPVNRTLRFYDDEGREMKVRREMWRDSSWFFRIQSTYFYEGEKIISRQDSVATTGSGKLFYINYKYNSNDELEAEITKRAINDSLVISLKVAYQYDQYGSPIQKEFPFWKDNQWVNSRKMTLVYNDRQHHIQTIRYNWKDNQWVENIRYDLTVDENGNRLAEDWKRFAGDSLKTITRVSYKYTD